MNTECFNRLKEAKKYQKMAIHALLPESAGKHMEVIEKEISEMFTECFMDIVQKEAKKMAEENIKKEEPVKSKEKSKTRKVEIS